MDTDREGHNPDEADLLVGDDRETSGCDKAQGDKRDEAEVLPTNDLPPFIPARSGNEEDRPHDEVADVVRGEQPDCRKTTALT